MLIKNERKRCLPHKSLRRKYPSKQTQSPRTQTVLGSVQTLPGVRQGELYCPRGTTTQQ